MRYYKPEKKELVKGFKCEIYNDDTYQWEKATITDPRAAKGIWHKGDLRVGYLSAEDLNELGYGVKFIFIGTKKNLVNVIVNDEGIEEEIYELEDVYSTEEADVLYDGLPIGKFYPFNFGDDNNLILINKGYSLKNINELIAILEIEPNPIKSETQNGKN
jgi:hypothetical protein